MVAQEGKEKGPNNDFLVSFLRAKRAVFIICISTRRVSLRICSSVCYSRTAAGALVSLPSTHARVISVCRRGFCFYISNKMP